MSTLGKAVIEMSVDRARFDADLARAAGRFGQTMSAMEAGAQGLMRSWQAAVGALAGGVGFASLIADAIKTRSALDDMADTLGGDVLALDGLRRQMLVSGLAFEQGSSALVKLSKNLNSADDEAKGAAQALRAIGLSADELRSKDIATQTLDIARALDVFQDGSGKVAVSMALMGREGAKMLPFLKDLANDGDAVGRITAEQAAQAEKLEKEWRRLTLAFKDGKEALAGGLLPVLGDWISEMREGLKLFGSIPSAMFNIGVALDPMKSFAQHIREGNAELAKLQKQLDELSVTPMASEKERSIEAAGVLGQMDTIRRRLAFVKFQQQSDALRLAGPGSLDARDLRAMQKGVLNFVPEDIGGKAAGAKDASADIARALQAERDILDEASRLGVKFLQDQDKAIEEHNRRLVEASNRGWIAHADEVFRQAEEQAIALAKIADETEKTTDLARDLGMTFSSAFEDAIVGGKKLSEVLRGLEADIMRLVTRELVTKPIAEGITGLAKKSGIGGFVEGILSRIGIGGGAGTAAGASAAATAGESALALLGQFAEGTDYVPQTGLYQLHQGEAVIPADENSGMRGGMTVNFYIESPNVDSFRYAQGQLMSDAYAEAARWNARNG